MSPPDVLSVSFLGAFSMRRPGDAAARTVTEQASTSKRIWPFLEYLLAFCKRPVAQEEIIDVLWNDAEISDPVNTLKTLLHRSRALLESLGFPDGKRVLLYRRGVYSWAPELTLSLDIDRFDALYARFTSAADPAEKAAAAAEAIPLYRGEFLPNAAGSPWTVSLRTYYHTKYLQLCAEAAQALRQLGRRPEAIEVCRTATTVDPYDEYCHLMLMRLLSESGSRQAAIQHYTYVSNLFMDHLGVSPSEEMTALYQQLTCSDENVKMDLRAIRSQLLEPRPGFGPYFCEYSVFQDIYRLQSRATVRSGQVIQLGIITLLGKQGDRLVPNDCAAAMDDLKRAIYANLRSGDTFTRFSAAQYLLLLPSANYENGTKVLQRVLDAFRRTAGGACAAPQFSLLPVIPYSQLDLLYLKRVDSLC